VPLTGFQRMLCSLLLTIRRRSTAGLKSMPKALPFNPMSNASPTGVACPVETTKYARLVLLIA
jgi:hypothetical protein